MKKEVKSTTLRSKFKSFRYSFNVWLLKCFLKRLTNVLPILSLFVANKNIISLTQCLV